MTQKGNDDGAHATNGQTVGISSASRLLIPINLAAFFRSNSIRLFIRGMLMEEDRIFSFFFFSLFCFSSFFLY